MLLLYETALPAADGQAVTAAYYVRVLLYIRYNVISMITAVLQ